jgi:hypothetical protein
MIRSLMMSLMPALMLVSPAVAQNTAPPGLSIELNALDQTGGACRLVFVARNGLAADVDGLVIEAVAFDAGGGVARIALFDFAQLPAGLPRVRQFDLPEMACDSIGSVLVNGVQSCAGPADCAESLTFSSRTDVELLG